MSVVSIICLNGPPGSGKDKVKDIMMSFLFNRMTTRVRCDKFAKPIDHIAAAIIGIKVDSDEFKELREPKKDEIIPALGITMRQLMMAISEDFIKPTLGKTYFGLRAADRTLEVCKPYSPERYWHLPPEVIIFSDSGFQYEYDAFKERLSDAGLSYASCVIQIHREGCTFDSRERVEDPGKTDIIHNNATLDVLEGKVIQCIRDLAITGFFS